MSELRVLNLAGNKIEVVTGVNQLSSLTELNVRRNKIHTILDGSIDKLFNLQRIFMSNNQVSSFHSIDALLSMKHLLELTLDGNPIATNPQPSSSSTHDENNQDVYRRTLLTSLSSLRDLDLKKISDSDRKVKSVYIYPFVCPYLVPHPPLSVSLHMSFTYISALLLIYLISLLNSIVFVVVKSACAEVRKLEEKRKQEEMLEEEEKQKKRSDQLRQEAILAAAGAWVNSGGAQASNEMTSSGMINGGINSQDNSVGLAAAAASAALAASQDMMKPPSNQSNKSHHHGTKLSPRLENLSTTSSTKLAKILNEDLDNNNNSSSLYSPSTNEENMTLTPLLFPSDRKPVVVPTISMMSSSSDSHQTSTNSSTIPNPHNMSSQLNGVNSEFNGEGISREGEGVQSSQSRYNPQHLSSLRETTQGRNRSRHEPVLDSEKHVGFFEFDPPLDQTTEKGARSLLIYGNVMIYFIII